MLLTLTKNFEYIFDNSLFFLTIKSSLTFKCQFNHFEETIILCTVLKKYWVWFFEILARKKATGKERPFFKWEKCPSLFEEEICYIRKVWRKSVDGYKIKGFKIFRKPINIFVIIVICKMQIRLSFLLVVHIFFGKKKIGPYLCTFPVSGKCTTRTRL